MLMHAYLPLLMLTHKLPSGALAVDTPARPRDVPHPMISSSASIVAPEGTSSSGGGGPSSSCKIAVYT